MNALLKRAICTVLFGAGLSGGTALAAKPAVAPPQVLSHAQVLEADSAAVAASFNIPVEEARRRLIVEEQAGAILEKIAATYKDRLAGSYIEHTPASRLVVRLTGDQAVRSQFHDGNGYTLEVEFRAGAGHTLAQLREAIEQVPAAVQGTAGVLGRYIDERKGVVVVELESALLKANAADLAATREALGATIGVPVRFEAGERAIVNDVYASGTLSPPGCTTGFTVYHAATVQNGVLTAGHCKEASGFTTYTGHPSIGGSHLLGNQGWLQTSQADLLWLGNTSVLFGGYFYANSWRAVTGRRTQAATATGATYCKYGKNSGYTCGTVFSAYSAPGSPICGPTSSSACSATFVRITGPAASTCLPGDSGGPWFGSGTASNIAAGIHFASNATGSICWYTTTDYAYSGLGLSLLYP